jgi:hypothetical protein
VDKQLCTRDSLFCRYVDLGVAAFLPKMKYQLSQLPKIVGSGRVRSDTRPFFWLIHF